MTASYVPVESLLESRAFRRLLAFSLALHVALFLIMTLRPHRSAVLISPSPVMVNVVDMPKPAGAAPVRKAAAKPPPPKPKPEAKPEPPKPKPKVDEIVIPKEPAPLAAKPKPAAKPELAAKPEPAPKSAEELLAELTKKVEARNPPSQPAAAAESGAAAPIAGGPGVFDPTLSPWVARVRTVVHSNWSGAQLCKAVPVFTLEVDENGALPTSSSRSRPATATATSRPSARSASPIRFPRLARGALALELGMNPKDTL